jgi:mRNA interferase RelE/StbE
MEYNFLYTNQAEKNLAKLDRSVYKKIKAKLDYYEQINFPLDFAKKLKGNDDIWRFRIGDYRVVFRVDPKTNNLVILIILKVAHRKDVYE